MLMGRRGMGKYVSKNETFEKGESSNTETFSLFRRGRNLGGDGTQAAAMNSAPSRYHHLPVTYLHLGRGLGL